MDDKYADLRAALPDLVEEARRKGGTNPRAQMIIDLLAERDALWEALDGLVGDIESLAAESDGVAGFHHNGDLATWAELMPGGRFEWLEHMDKARAALAQEQGEQHDNQD